MARKTPEQIVRKFQARIAQAGPEYQAGVTNPTREWLEGYRAGARRMEAELMRALQEGRHLRGAQAKADRWRNRVMAVGAQRFTQAAQVAAEEYSKVAADILAAGESARNAANALPDTSLEERLQRAMAAMRAIHDYWRTKRGR
jgi:hypothetical protein